MPASAVSAAKSSRTSGPRPANPAAKAAKRPTTTPPTSPLAKRFKQKTTNLEAPAASPSSAPQCKLCSKKASASTKWAAEFCPGPGLSPVPHGDFCFACVQFHATAFGHISIEELAELRETGRADQIKQARSVMAGGEPDWLPDAVTAEMHSTIKIQRSMAIMNSTEYQQHFKRKPPGRRGPKIPQLTVPREGYPSESEKVFCFTDPQQPHRNAHVSTQLVDKKITHRMQHDKNFFESQGREVFEFGCQAHQQEVSNGWLAKPIILPGIHEHMAKVNPERAEAEHHHHQFHDSQLSMDTTEGTDDVAVSPPLVASGVVNQVAVGNLLGRSVVSPGSLQPPQSSPKADKKKTPQHGSPSEPGLRKLGSASEIDPCDSASQGGSGIDDMRDMEMKNKSSSDKLKILKSRMPLKDLMMGVKLGRQERNARQFLTNDKLDPADTKLLRAYFKLVSHLF